MSRGPVRTGNLEPIHAGKSSNGLLGPSKNTRWNNSQDERFTTLWSSHSRAETFWAKRGTSSVHRLTGPDAGGRFPPGIRISSGSKSADDDTPSPPSPYPLSPTFHLVRKIRVHEGICGPASP